MKWLRFLFRNKIGVNSKAKSDKNPTKYTKQEWRYGVAGNITKEHYDDRGVLRYGSSAFCRGAKVYLCGKYWSKGQDTIGVIGLNRYKRMVFDDVSPELIENIRCTKVYKPSVLKIMDNWEFSDCWWGNTQKDKKATEEFVNRWNSK